MVIEWPWIDMIAENIKVPILLLTWSLVKPTKQIGNSGLKYK